MQGSCNRFSEGGRVKPPSRALVRQVPPPGEVLGVPYHDLHEAQGAALPPWSPGFTPRRQGGGESSPGVVIDTDRVVSRLSHPIVHHRKAFYQHSLHVHAKRGLQKPCHAVTKGARGRGFNSRTRSVGGDGVGDTRARDRRRRRHLRWRGVVIDSLLAC